MTDEPCFDGINKKAACCWIDASADFCCCLYYTKGSSIVVLSLDDCIEMANAFENHEDSSVEANIWSAADKGDTAKLKELLDKGRDVNCRNCLGCTPLLYACGSGHLETVCKN